MKHLKMFEDFTIDGFDMEYFKQLSSFRKRIDYCGKYLKRLSSGSSRIVYIVDEQKVLKIAKNTRGLEQNRAEGDYFIQKKYIDVVGIPQNTASSKLAKQSIVDLSCIFCNKRKIVDLNFVGIYQRR